MRQHFALAALIMLPVAAAAEVPSVATDIAPVHSLAAQVMSGLGEPAMIVRPGASPHGYAMRPSEAVALENADLVVWIGAALEPWLEGPIDTLARGETLGLLSVAGTSLLSYRNGQAHAEGVEHEHATTDPHAWLDPQNGKLWLSAIADALAALDPENTETYRANANLGAIRIDAAAGAAADLLAPLRGAPFVVYHDAYQYLEARFDMPASTSLALGDAAPPPPARVGGIAAQLRETGARCIFTEPQFSPALVRTVTEGTGARIAILDPLGGSIDPGPDLYPELIRNLAQAIADCAATK